MGGTPSVIKPTLDDGGTELANVHTALQTLPANDRRRVLHHFHCCVEEFNRNPLCDDTFYNCCKDLHMARIVEIMDQLRGRASGNIIQSLDDMQLYREKIVLICRIRCSLLHEMAGIPYSNPPRLDNADAKKGQPTFIPPCCRRKNHQPRPPTRRSTICY